MFFATP